jgi:hypothetical protein
LRTFCQHEANKTPDDRCCGHGRAPASAAGDLQMVRGSTRQHTRQGPKGAKADQHLPLVVGASASSRRSPGRPQHRTVSLTVPSCKLMLLAACPTAHGGLLEHPVDGFVAVVGGGQGDVKGDMDPIFIWFGVASAAGTTAISVTHDQSEFDSLGNRSPRTLSKATAHAEGAASACVLHIPGLVLRIYCMFLSIEVLHMPVPRHPERHCPRPCRSAYFSYCLVLPLQAAADVRSVCLCGVFCAYGACVPAQKED